MSAIRSMLAPKVVAVVGASEDESKFGGRLFGNVLRFGFAGRIYPINPTRPQVSGLTAYKAIRDVPEAIDVAALAVPAHQLQAVVEECAAAGVKAAIVITSNFAEVGDAGLVRQERLVATARAANMRILGPNCLGFIRPGLKLALTPSVAVLRRTTLAAGAIGLASQSGALMAVMYAQAAAIGAGISACVSVGNQADIELCDVLDVLIEDPETKVIACYAEGFRDPARFVRCLEAAAHSGKPFLLTKAGRTETGSAAVRSHTASVAGSFEVLAAVCRRYGAIVIDDPMELMRAADLAVRVPRARGEKVAIISGSGGACAITADFLDARGIALATLDAQARDKIAPLLPESHRQFPLDLGALETGWEAKGLAQVAELAFAEVGVDIVCLSLTTQPMMTETVRFCVEASRRHVKPLVIVTSGALVDEEMGPLLTELKHPWFPSLDSGGRALDVLCETRLRPGLVLPARPPIVDWRSRPYPHETRYIGEIAAKRMLHDIRVRVPRGGFAASADEAVAIAESIGYPVALKSASAGLVHKSDAGGVRLGLRSAAELRSAWSDMAAALAARGIRDDEGGLVEEMIAGVAELIIGARFDREFGPVIMIGAGGLFVELLRDVAITPAPVSEREAADMLRSLRLWPLLDGARGRPKADVAAAARVAAQLGALAYERGPEFLEFDINPLIVLPAGGGAVAVDARATVAAASPETQTKQ